MAGGVGKSANEEMRAIAEAAQLRKEREGMGAGSEGDEAGIGGTRSDRDVYVDFDGKRHLSTKKWYDFWS